jgi:hypothetical protein
MQRHLVAALGELPGGLAAREAATNDMDHVPTGSASAFSGSATAHSFWHFRHFR